MENLPSSVQEEIVFLKENKEFIVALTQVQTIFKIICKDLKHSGFDAVQKQAY